MSYENIPHGITPPGAGTFDIGQDGPCFHVVYALTLCCKRSWDLVTFLQSSVIQLWWVCANCSLIFLFLSRQEEHPVWSSATLVDLFWAFLQTSVLTSTCSCCVLISSKRSPLTNATSNQGDCYFLFFRLSSVNSTEGCVADQQFVK